MGDLELEWKLGRVTHVWTHPAVAGNAAIPYMTGLGILRVQAHLPMGMFHPISDSCEIPCS